MSMFAPGTEYIIKMRGDDEPLATGGFDSIQSLHGMIRGGWKNGDTIDVWSPQDNGMVVSCIINPDDISSIADVRGLDT